MNEPQGYVVRERERGPQVGDPGAAAIGRPIAGVPESISSRRSRSSARLRRVSGWLIGVALGLSPLAYGLRVWSSQLVVGALVAAATIAWAPSARRRGGFNRSGRVVRAIAGFLALYMLIALLNASSAFDPSRHRLAPSPHLAWLPSTVNVPNSLISTLFIAACLCVVTVTADLGRSPQLRRRLCLLIGIVGAANAGIGVLQATPLLSELRSLLRSSPWSDAHPFGLYPHNVAAAVMSVSIPAVGALVVGGDRWQRSVGSACILFIAAAATVNISRTGLVLSSLTAAFTLAVVWWPPRVSGTSRIMRQASIAASPILLVAVLVFVLQPKVLDRLTVGDRWSTYYPRYLQSHAAIELIHRNPLLGHGVGSYRMLAQTTSAVGGIYLAPPYEPGEPFTLTLTVANDYLQTIVEWGFIGALGWTLLIVPGLYLCGAAALRSPDRGCRRQAALVFCSLVALMFHALVDCPMQVPGVQLLGAALLGIAWAAPGWSDVASSPSEFRET